MSSEDTFVNTIVDLFLGWRWFLLGRVLLLKSLKQSFVISMYAFKALPYFFYQFQSTDLVAMVPLLFRTYLYRWWKFNAMCLFISIPSQCTFITVKWIWDILQHLDAVSLLYWTLWDWNPSSEPCSLGIFPFTTAKRRSQGEGMWGRGNLIHKQRGNTKNNGQTTQLPGWSGGCIVYTQQCNPFHVYFGD